MKACPYRKDFYAKLGTPEDRVRAQLREWLDALDRIVLRMKVIYECVACG